MLVGPRSLAACTVNTVLTASGAVAYFFFGAGAPGFGAAVMGFAAGLLAAAAGLFSGFFLGSFMLKTLQ